MFTNKAFQAGISFLILICLSNTTYAKRDFLLVISKLECHNNVPSFAEFECQLNQRGNRSFFSGRVLGRRVARKIIVKAVLTPMLPYMSQLNKLNLTVDGCKLLKEAPKHFIWKTVLKYVRRYVNEVPRSCPLKSNFNYTVKDVYVDEENIPSFAPPGKYKLQGFAYVNDVPTFDVIAHFDVVYPKKRF